MKNIFIENEIWILTFGGAFQRSAIYQIAATDKQKANFRNKIKDQIRTLIVRDYSDKACSTEQHVNNILDFCTWTDNNFGSLLNGGKLNFGVAQKLINLYLKYSWCLGKIEHTPPHCPFDRIIISELIKHEIPAWTKMDSPEAYLDLVKLAQEKSGNNSIADWELGFFNRRN